MPSLCRILQPFVQRRTVQMATVQHHGPDLLRVADVLQRVGVKQDQVRELPRCDGSSGSGIRTCRNNFIAIRPNRPPNRSSGVGTVVQVAIVHHHYALDQYVPDAC